MYSQKSPLSVVLAAESTFMGNPADGALKEIYLTDPREGHLCGGVVLLQGVSPGGTITEIIRIYIGEDKILQFQFDTENEALSTFRWYLNCSAVTPGSPTTITVDMRAVLEWNGTVEIFTGEPVTIDTSAYRGYLELGDFNITGESDESGKGVIVLANIIT